METIKTAVSLNRKLFEQAEQLAHELNVSRSRLYSLALEEYIQRRRNQALLDQLNAAYADELGAEEAAMLARMRRLQRHTGDGAG